MKIKFSLSKVILIAIVIYVSLAVISLLLAKVFSVNNGNAGVYFSNFTSPVSIEIKDKFLNSQSFLLKPPFVFSYSLALVVNSDGFLEAYESRPVDHSQEEILQYKQKIAKQGHCTLGGKYGSWEVWVYAYGFFGYPHKVILTCNSGLK